MQLHTQFVTSLPLAEILSVVIFEHALFLVTVISFSSPDGSYTTYTYSRPVPTFIPTLTKISYTLLYYCITIALLNNTQVLY